MSPHNRRENGACGRLMSPYRGNPCAVAGGLLHVLPHVLVRTAPRDLTICCTKRTAFTAFTEGGVVETNICCIGLGNFYTFGCGDRCSVAAPDPIYVADTFAEANCSLQRSPCISPLAGSIQLRPFESSRRSSRLSYIVLSSECHSPTLLNQPWQ